MSDHGTEKRDNNPAEWARALLATIPDMTTRLPIIWDVFVTDDHGTPAKAGRLRLDPDHMLTVLEASEAEAGALNTMTARLNQRDEFFIPAGKDGHGHKIDIGIPRGDAKFPHLIARELQQHMYSLTIVAGTADE